jgi:hypothetical protein
MSETGVVFWSWSTATPSHERGLIAGAVTVGVAIWVRRVFRDRARQTSPVLAEVALVVVAAGICSVRAIRGETLPYLTAWCSVGGLLVAMSAVSAGVELAVQQGRMLIGVVSTVVIGLTAFQARNRQVLTAGDEVTASLIRQMETSAPTFERQVAIRIRNDDVWPQGIGLALFLQKRGHALFVDSPWDAVAAVASISAKAAGPTTYITVSRADGIGSDERPRAIAFAERVTVLRK